MPRTTPRRSRRAPRGGRFFSGFMAFSRSEYVNRLGYKLTGALIEFYKARLAGKNGQTRWVRHWSKEVKRLIEVEFYAELLKPTSFTDRKKALRKAIEETRAIDHTCRTAAANKYAKDFGARPHVGLDDGDTRAFWVYVQQTIDIAPI